MDKVEEVNATVKRLTCGCCGMETGIVYDACVEPGGTYINVRLPNGEWIGSHFAPGHFEILTVTPEVQKTL